MSALEVAKKLAEGSGNSFHSRVARWFQENGWYVLISPYYMDQSQGKAREIDLIAEKAIPIIDFMGRAQGDVVVRLYVECKFISATSVLWFTEKDRVSAEDLVCRAGGFRTDNAYTNRHHYLSSCPSVAKIFATAAKSQEQEPIYKALNQVLGAQVSMETRPMASPILRRQHGGLRAVLSFPVVVCSDFNQLFKAEFFEDSDPERITENFQLEVRYAFTDSSGNPKDDYFLIDFVSYDLLDDFTAKVLCNAETSAFLLQS